MSDTANYMAKRNNFAYSVAYLAGMMDLIAYLGIIDLDPHGNEVDAMLLIAREHDGDLSDQRARSSTLTQDSAHAVPLEHTEQRKSSSSS